MDWLLKVRRALLAFSARLKLRKSVGNIWFLLPLQLDILDHVWHLGIIRENAEYRFSGAIFLSTVEPM